MLGKIVLWIVLLELAQNSTATDGVPCKSNDYKCIQAARLSQSWYSYYTGGLFSASSLFLMALAVALGVYISRVVASQTALPWKLYQYQSRIFLINQKNGEVISDVDDVEKLKTQLADVEKERDDMKAELEKYRASEEVDSVMGQKWEETDHIALPPSPPRLEIENVEVSAADKSAVVVNKRKFELTNADYSRKCRYLTKKLKDTETLIKTMKTQVEMAKEIKTEFSELKEQRTEMGRQVVALTREKREAKQKVLTLQTDMRTWRKQMDCVVTRNTELLKQVEQLNNNLKATAREKRNLKKLAENAAEELDLVRTKLDSIHKEKEELVKKLERSEMDRISSLDNSIRSVDVSGNQSNREVQVYSAQVYTRKNLTPRPFEAARFELLETKFDEHDAGENKNVGLNIVREFKNETPDGGTRSIAIKELERSLMKLERSVEENMRLRNSAVSIISVPIELSHDPETGPLRTKSRETLVGETPSDTESIPCLYAGIPTSAVHVPSEISCLNSSVDSMETEKLDAVSECSLATTSEGGEKKVEHEISVCCMDSQCSVCSVPGCTLLHVSCSDVTCLTTISSMEMQEREAVGGEEGGEAGQQLDCAELRRPASCDLLEEPRPEPPVRRSTGVERLADIFGNGPIGEGGPWNIPGLSTIMLNTGVRPTGSVVVNAGSQAVSSVGGEVGDCLSNSTRDISSSDGSVGSAGSLMTSSPDVTTASDLITPATAPHIVLNNNNNNNNKKFSCFTANNDSRVVSSSLAFRQFLNEMAVVTDDPDIGDEEAPVEE